MAYQSGGLIEAKDYNKAAWGTDAGGSYTNALNNIAYVMGQGYGRYGYGQSVSGFSAVAIGTTVTAPQWTGLLNGINTALSHQNNTTISPLSVTTGATITYYSSITTGVTNAWNNANTAAVNTRSAATAVNVPGTTGWGGGTLRIGRFTLTAAWSTADLARYWWNAGGAIDLSFSLNPTTGSTRITDWNSLLTACGTIRLGYNTTTKTGGSGTATTLLTSSGGYWLGTSVGSAHAGTSTLQFKQLSPNAPYTTDYVSVTTQYAGTPSNGGYPVMTIIVDFANSYINTFQNTVNSVPTVTYQIQNPGGNVLGTVPTSPNLTNTPATFQNL